MRPTLLHRGGRACAAAIPMSVHPDPAAATPAPRPALTLPRLRDMAARGEKLAVLTCYDATFAQLLDAPASTSCWSATRWAT
jgi:hypothetical protein